MILGPGARGPGVLGHKTVWLRRRLDKGNSLPIAAKTSQSVRREKKKKKKRKKRTGTGWRRSCPLFPAHLAGRNEADEKSLTRRAFQMLRRAREARPERWPLGPSSCCLSFLKKTRKSICGLVGAGAFLCFFFPAIFFPFIISDSLLKTHRITHTPTVFFLSSPQKSCVHAPSPVPIADRG